MELSITSIFVLTSLLIFSNILLTIRLLNTYDLKADTESITHNVNRQKHQTPMQFIEARCPTVEPIKDEVLMDTPWSNQTTPLKNFDINISRWDVRRMFRLYDNVIVGQKFTALSKYYNVTLATQSSLERLSSIVQVAYHWAGPISISVYAAGNEEFNLLLLYLHYLQQCFVQIREQVSFHLVIPQEGQPSSMYINYVQLEKINDCTNPDKVLKMLLKSRTPQTIKWRVRNPYPQNLMRNVARKTSQSSFVFLTDVDIIPSYHMADGLRLFMKSNIMCLSKKCAYVIPTFELDDRVNFPKNKTDLLRLIKKGLARPFHEKVLIYNQFATNITKWKDHRDIVNSNGQVDVHISHTVTNYEFLYEPFYVALDTVPAHDERFLGYGFTRNTQVYEMFMAGYTFYVLSPIFTCHWGLQLKKTRPHWRERQNTMNGRQFELFKREIFAKYNKDPLHMVKTQLKGSKKTH